MMPDSSPRWVQAQQQQQQQQQVSMPGGAQWNVLGATPGSQQQQQQQQGQLNPRTYYEPVEPSNWRPSTEGSCLDLYRRAYLRRADWLFPPCFFLLLAALCSLRPPLPFWSLAASALVLFFFGMWLMVVVWAGIAPKALSGSAVLPCFVLCIEAVYPLLLLRGLPAAWADAPGEAAVALAALVAVAGLHLQLAWSDPGFVLSAQHKGSTRDRGGRAGGISADAWAKEPALATSTGGRKGSGAAAAAAAHKPAAGGVDTQDELQPLCKEGGASRGGSGGGDAALGAALGAHACLTCQVDRPLRAKHCGLCGKCVARFDHHCPVAFNCIGAGNQRTFVAYLGAVAASQVLFIHLAAGLLARAGRAVGASSSAALLPAVWAARDSQPALLLLVLLQLPLLVACTLLLLRSLALAAANLTVNEWLNRQRYLHLRHETAGFCNRFDEGPAHNCLQFWCVPAGQVDWWHEFDAADRQMVKRGMTVVTTASATLVLRAWDAAWSVMSVRLAETRQIRAEARLQRRLRAAGLAAPACEAHWGGGGGAAPHTSTPCSGCDKRDH